MNYFGGYMTCITLAFMFTVASCFGYNAQTDAKSYFLFQNISPSDMIIYMQWADWAYSLWEADSEVYCSFSMPHAFSEG